ncbi:integrase core domain-containing protein [Rhodococcus sp. NPDC006774]|uniref:integrase core domain-containing protein n=1 Tax=Rhodococcus sp. NPDC006774 TaxID=3157186 RepID=UPI0033DDA558
MSYIPPGTPWNDGHIESLNNRLRKECLNRIHWTSLLEARVVIGYFKDGHNNRPRHSSLDRQLSTVPNSPTPTDPWAARSTHINHTGAIERGGPTIVDRPPPLVRGVG